jgi:hypothetical protein
MSECFIGQGEREGGWNREVEKEKEREKHVSKLKTAPKLDASTYDYY